MSKSMSFNDVMKGIEKEMFEDRPVAPIMVEVRQALQEERAYQDSIWNHSNVQSRMSMDYHQPRSGRRQDQPEELLMYIERHLRKAIDVMVDKPQPEADIEVLNIIRKTAALAVAGLELRGLPEPEKQKWSMNGMVNSLVDKLAPEPDFGPMGNPSPLSVYLLIYKRKAERGLAGLLDGDAEPQEVLLDVASMGTQIMAEYGIERRVVVSNEGDENRPGKRRPGP